MNEQTKNKLNANDTLNNRIPQLIEIFVRYYGEEEREFITEKLQNCLLIAYTTMDDKIEIIKKNSRETKKELERARLIASPAMAPLFVVVGGESSLK